MGIFKKIGIEADTDLLTRPSVDLEEDDGGHDRFSHYVKKEKIVESAVTGKAVKALCGKKWIPSRDCATSKGAIATRDVSENTTSFSNNDF